VKKEKDKLIMSSFLDSTASLNRQVFEEDKMICTKVPASSWSREVPKYSASHDEERILHFRKMYREAFDL
jgi:hypothetical protein